jgi:hypothetical protein
MNKKIIILVLIILIFQVSFAASLNLPVEEISRQSMGPSFLLDYYNPEHIKIAKENMAKEIAIAKEREQEKGKLFYKYFFGDIPRDSYQFLIVVLVWILIASIAFILISKLIKKLWISISSSICIALVFANLKIIKIISNFILSYALSNISRVLIALLIILLIIFEFIVSKKR